MERLFAARAWRLLAMAAFTSGAIACSGQPVSTAPAPNGVPTVPTVSTTHAAAVLQGDSQPQSSRAIKRVGRYYVNRPYGSDLEFNPLTVVVNEGWDMFRLVDDRNVFGVRYGEPWQRLWKSIGAPGATIKQYGVSRWLRNEVFPLTFGGKGGQWEPNYHLHLFGAGMTYIRTAEWFEQHDVPHPRIASALTLMTGHVFNELVENIGHVGYNEDGLTDLLLFDPAGMLLWNTQWMQRTFSGRVEMTTWYGQPILTPDQRLENSYSMFMLRAPFPKSDNWRVLTTGGNAFLFGASRRVGREHWLSLSGGAVPVDVPIIDSTTNTQTVKLRPNVGIFFDRNGSLLASFIGLSGKTNGATLNIYPGIVGSGRWSPGFFVQKATGGIDGHGLRFGVISSVGLGFGSVAARPR